MSGPVIPERLDNAARATINVAFSAILATLFPLSAVVESPRTTAIVASIRVVTIATLSGRRLVARRQPDIPLSASEPADFPQPSVFEMPNTPPLPPVLIDVGVVGFGLVTSLFLSIWAAINLVGRESRRDDTPAPARAWPVSKRRPICST